MSEIIVYKDKDMFYVPSSLMNYGTMLELNGRITDKSSIGKEFITVDNLQTIRITEKTRVPIEYRYGAHVIPIVDYNTRLEYLKKTYKEKIDEKYEDDGEKHNVCIWKNKDAEVEYYSLTNKYTCVYESIIKFGEYLQFVVVDLPRSPNKYITADWKTSNTLVGTATIDKALLIDDICKDIEKKYKGVLTVKNYTGSYSSYFYINDTRYDMKSGTYRGTLTECKTIESTIRKTFKNALDIELGKLKHKVLVDSGSVLTDMDEIFKEFIKINSKIATQGNKEVCYKLIVALKNKLEMEVKNG